MLPQDPPHPSLSGMPLPSTEHKVLIHIQRSKLDGNTREREVRVVTAILYVCTYIYTVHVAGYNMRVQYMYISCKIMFVCNCLASNHNTFMYRCMLLCSCNKIIIMIHVHVYAVYFVKIVKVYFFVPCAHRTLTVVRIPPTWRRYIGSRGN